MDKLLDFGFKDIIFNFIVDGKHCFHDTHEHRHEFIAEVEVVVIEHFKDHNAVGDDSCMGKVGKDGKGVSS
jgi:hypothetical protein